MSESTSVGGGLNAAFPVSGRAQMGLRCRLQYDSVDITNQKIVIDRQGKLVASTIRDADGAVRQPLPSDITEASQQVVDVCDVRYRCRCSSCPSATEGISSINGFSLNWDGANDPIEPTRGLDMQFSQEGAGLGGDVQTLRPEVSATGYYAILPSLRASLRLSAGHVQPSGDDITAGINNRFFRGGWALRSSSLGGNVYDQGAFELILPNVVPEEYRIKSAFLVDTGGPGSLHDQDSVAPNSCTDASTGYHAIQDMETGAALTAATGISPIWGASFGPLRFDDLQALKSEDHD